MAKQTINIGSAELAGDGESIRSAFNKVNSNFTELYERDLNTDSQTLTLVDDTLTITGGNSVNLDQYSKFSGAYTDLTDLPSLVTSYNQLTDLPSIPADIGDLTDTGNLLSPGPASELVGVTVAAVGGTASANETGITYSNKIAIFTVGAFTVGEWTDVQIGWTVTDNNGFTDTIASRGGFGAASFVTTVNNWPAPASGKTYVFTSPDYQPASVNPVEITVGNNDWLFNNNGSVTFPDATVQTTAYTGTAENIESENSVSIRINLTDSTLRTWQFNENGNLTLPSGGLLGQVWEDGIATELTLKSPPGVGDSGYVALSSANERNYVEVSNIGIVLGVEFGQAAFKTLTFGTDGNLKSADGEPLQILSTGASGAVSMAWSSSLNSPENIALVIANSPGAQTSGAVDIVVGAPASPNIWTFDPSGALTIPGDIQSESNISININLSDSTTRTWHFGEDGNLQAPGIVSAPNVNATSSFGLPVYATEAARDSAITSPQPGMMVYVSSGEGQGLQVRGATQWNPVGGLTGV